jgi:uncharacterized membrane protein YbhN (UPF0104 family)
MTEPKTKKAWRGWVVRLAGTAVVLGLLFYLLPFQELWQTMRRISLAAWLLVLAGYLGLHLMGVIKWRMMVNLAGAGLDYPQAARCYFAGLFGNLFLPSLVGGDVIRAGMALKLGKSKAGVLLGSLLDRMLDMAALASVAALGALLIPGHLDPQVARTFRTVLIVLGAGGLGGLAVMWLVLRRRFSFRIRRKLVRVRTAARRMARHPARVVLAWVLGLFFQVGLVLLMSRIAAECGLFVPLSAWLFAYPMAKLASLLPVTQGGIGVREAALAVLLVPFGAPPVLTVATGLVWETVIYVAALTGGIFQLFAGRRNAA